MIRIIHRDLRPSGDPTRHHNNALCSPPVEPLELAVRPTRMIDKPGEIPHPPLVDLVPPTARATQHHIDAFNAVRDESHELADSHAAVKVTPRHDPVILPTGCPEQLHRHMAAHAAKQRRKAHALVLFDLVRLPLLARGAHPRVQPWDHARVVRAEHRSVNHTLVDEPIPERVGGVVWRLEMRVGRRQRDRGTAGHRHPFMRMAMVSPGRPLPDDLEQIPPVRVEGVSDELQAGLDGSEPRGEPIAKPTAVFAEPVHAGAGEDETGPAASVFDFFVSAPDCARDVRRWVFVTGWGGLHPVPKILFFPGERCAGLLQRDHPGLRR